MLSFDLNKEILTPDAIISSSHFINKENTKLVTRCF
jgi:hypothetical protein